MLIVLDLNGTLVDSTHTVRPGLVPHAKARSKFLYYRPNMFWFLEYLFEHFDVAVWTSHTEPNARAIVDVIFTPSQRDALKFLWTRDECELGEGFSSTKNLARLPRSDALIIDDSPEKIQDASRHVCVPTFVASERSLSTDSELHKLMHGLLRSLRDAELVCA